VLAERRRLCELSTQPPEQAHLRGLHAMNCMREPVRAL
jgi:hypothetical protein